MATNASIDLRLSEPEQLSPEDGEAPGVTCPRRDGGFGESGVLPSLPLRRLRLAFAPPPQRAAGASNFWTRSGEAGCGLAVDSLNVFFEEGGSSSRTPPGGATRAVELLP